MQVTVGLTAVVMTVVRAEPLVLTVGTEPARLPAGPLDPRADGTLERALRRWVRETTGIDLGYVEQLYTFGDAGRGTDPAKRDLAVVYLGLVRPEDPVPPARWVRLYDHLPWEDRRAGGRPWEEAAVDWVSRAASAERDIRKERVALTFGSSDAWDVERSLERYQLLYEMGAVPEAGGAGIPGEPMGGDDRRALAQALGRVRAKIQYRPVIFELMPEAFTLRSLQEVAEALAGVALHTQNFRRLLDRARLVEGTGRFDTTTGGRPAELHRFRRDVVLERPAPGIGLPGMRTAG